MKKLKVIQRVKLKLSFKFFSSNYFSSTIGRCSKIYFRKDNSRIIKNYTEMFFKINKCTGALQDRSLSGGWGMYLWSKKNYPEKIIFALFRKNFLKKWFLQLSPLFAKGGRVVARYKVNIGLRTSCTWLPLNVLFHDFNISCLFHLPSDLFIKLWASKSERKGRNITCFIL